MDRLETRELAYFVAVAEELHFGRAASRLGIAQPPLSRAVKQLERRLGVTLLDRGSRGVTLTPAGDVLLNEGRMALAAVAAAGRRAQRAGRGDPRRVLVMKPGGDGGLLPDILREYGADPDSIPVDVVCRFADRARLLRDGQADVGLLHLPHADVTGLDTEKLLVERQVAVLPRRHRLAGRTSLRMADLSGETLPRWPDTPADGAADGPAVQDAGQLMQLIALGHTIAVLPASVEVQLRGNLTAVAVVDAAPTTVVVAWPEASRSRPVASFVRAAVAVAGRRPPLDP